MHVVAVPDRAALLRAEKEITHVALTLPADAPVTLPAGLWLALHRDLEEGRAACAALEAYKARVAEMDPPRLVVVTGGEEFTGRTCAYEVDE